MYIVDKAYYRSASFYDLFIFRSFSYLVVNFLWIVVAICVLWIVIAICELQSRRRALPDRRSNDIAGAYLWMARGSAALLADIIHHLDALAIVPRGIAFKVDQWRPNDRFTCGYDGVEDLAGLIIVVVIALSAATVAYESLTRLVKRMKKAIFSLLQSRP